MFNLAEVLSTVRIVSTFPTTTTAPDYERDIGADDEGVFFLNDDTTTTLNLEASVRIANHVYTVSLERNDGERAHLTYVTHSGIACVWLAVLDALGVRFNFMKPMNAAYELEAWLDGVGHDTDEGRIINAINDRIEKLANGAAKAYDNEHALLAA